MRLQSSDSLTRTGRQTPVRTLCSLASQYWPLAGASVPLHVDVSTGLLSVLMAWKLASFRAGDPGEQGVHCNAFYDLPLGLINNQFCSNIDHTGPALIHCEEGPHKYINSGRLRLSGPISAAGYHTHR